jgi:hypothetical protein
MVMLMVCLAASVSYDLDLMAAPVNYTGVPPSEFARANAMEPVPGAVISDMGLPKLP